MAPPPAIAAVTATGPSPSSAASLAGTTLKQEAQASNQEVYDKLIDVFQQKTPEEWRKLIAFSRQWPSLAQGVLDRCGGQDTAQHGGSSAAGGFLEVHGRWSAPHLLTVE